METATLFTLAQRHALPAASVLVVSDLLRPDGVRIEPQRLEAAVREMGTSRSGR